MKPIKTGKSAATSLRSEGVPPAIADRLRQSLIPSVTLPRVHGTFFAPMKPLISVCAVSLALGVMTGGAAEPKTQTKEEPKKAETKSDSKEKASAKEVAVMKTSLGELVIEFWPDVAPKTV